jgi:ABC-type thiamin/hydroxymethylpyrimidine transport system permease subunit
MVTRLDCFINEVIKTFFFDIKQTSLAEKVQFGFWMVKNKMAAIAIQKPDIYVWFLNGLLA